MAPLPDEMIFPKDELLVLGTDEHVERFRQRVEHPPGLTERFKSLAGYLLTPFAVDGKSALAGKRIRDSGIREICGGMVVGIERSAQRIINPDSDLVLETGDILFIVAEAESIKKLALRTRERGRRRCRFWQFRQDRPEKPDYTFVTNIAASLGPSSHRN